MDRDFHATYSGSMIHRLLAGCYGSVRLAKTVPPAPETQWQREGTEAHAELERRLSDRNSQPGNNPGVELAVDYVAQLLVDMQDGQVWAEHRVVFPQKHVLPRECSGTLDVMVADPHRGRVWIIDYKHGAGEFVSAEENAQLMFYAWSALQGKFGWWNQDLGFAWIKDITLVIIQPNSWQDAEPIREYKTTPLGLFDFARAVERAIEQAERLHAPLLPGDHCKFCPAAPVCTAREREALAVMTGDEPGTIREWQPAELPKPQDLDAARLGQVVVKAPAIRAWLKSVEDYAEARAVAGDLDVPGCKVVEAPARRKWCASQDEIANQLVDDLLRYEGDDIDIREMVYPRQLIGITAAEKLVVEAATRGIEGTAEKRAAIAKAKGAFSALTVKESSGALSLVPLSDPRPPVNRAAKHFGGVKVVEIEA